MPIVYRCSRCKTVIYFDDARSPTGIPTPDYIGTLYSGACPYCGKPLGRPRHSDVRLYVDVARRLQEITERERVVPPAREKLAEYMAKRGGRR